MDKLDAAEKERFRIAIGAVNQADDTILGNFRDGVWEPRICEYFGVPTESAKVAKATFDAAWYAKAAFIATLAIGVASIIVSVILASRSH
jgi:hypothetical protein